MERKPFFACCYSMDIFLKDILTIPDIHVYTNFDKLNIQYSNDLLPNTYFSTYFRFCPFCGSLMQAMKDFEKSEETY